MSNITELTSIRDVQQGESLEDFLAAIERRAYRMAQIGVGEDDAALDIVQDSMMKLVQHYRTRPAAQWRPLFYRILHNRINDWHRSQGSRWKVFERWFGRQEEEADPLDQFPGGMADEPDQQLLSSTTLAAIERAVSHLSNRQQQAFMLRCWEGMSTAETAAVMDCSEGTVKTLYSRALANVRDYLQTMGEQYEG